MSLIVKIILLALLSPLTSFSVRAPHKTQFFVHFSFNYTLQLINGILSDIQKYLNILMTQQLLHFFKIPLAVLAGRATAL